MAPRGAEEGAEQAEGFLLSGSTQAFSLGISNRGNLIQGGTYRVMEGLENQAER